MPGHLPFVPFLKFVEQKILEVTAEESLTVTDLPVGGVKSRCVLASQKMGALRTEDYWRILDLGGEFKLLNSSLRHHMYLYVSLAPHAYDELIDIAPYNLPDALEEADIYCTKSTWTYISTLGGTNKYNAQGDTLYVSVWLSIYNPSAGDKSGAFWSKNVRGSMLIYGVEES